MTRSFHFLGVRLDAFTIAGLNTLIADIIKSGDRAIIANHNLHSVYLYHHEPKMRAFYDQAAQYVQIDGMSLVIMGKLLGIPLSKNERVTYIDWVYPLMSEAIRHHWRVFYLGSKPGVAERGAEILKNQFPTLQISTAHGYFDPRPGTQENRALLDTIHSYQPHILMVGMGMPRQEHWILDNLKSLNVGVILTAGACMDYVANEVPTPPRWLGKWGLEWAFRFAIEPRRLWRRYLVEPWFVLGLFLKEALGGAAKQKYE